MGGVTLQRVEVLVTWGTTLQSVEVLIRSGITLQFVERKNYLTDVYWAETILPCVKCGPVCARVVLTKWTRHSLYGMTARERLFTQGRGINLKLQIMDSCFENQQL